MEELDCLDLQMITEDFIDDMYAQYNLDSHQVYLLLWYLFNANIDKTLIHLPIVVITEAKNYIIRRKLYAKDSKRSADIEAHCEDLCRYIQSNKSMGLA